LAPFSIGKQLVVVNPDSSFYQNTITYTAQKPLNPEVSAKLKKWLENKLQTENIKIARTN